MPGRGQVRDRRQPVPPGRTTFELTLGRLRVRLVDLPTSWDPFVTEQYAPFAEVPQPGREADLVVRCREEPGTFVPLPPPGEITRLLLEREGPRRFSVRSHWQKGYLDLDRGEGELVLGDRVWDRFSMSVENYLRIAAQLAAIEKGAFLLHTAGVLHRGRVYLFFGPSGAGKSTATALSAPREALSDDMVLVDTAAPVTAHAVPFFMVYPPEKRLRGAWPVAAALRLRQAAEDRLERLSPARAVATVAASVPFVHELGLSHEGLTRLVAAFCREVPVCDLHFTKSARFWRVLEQELGA
ncbi:MAG: hypothetical protein D6718_09460 [Acidobacteria bacterium]|nr:MAG: hypothetical protein D6718_09460 [Acidobacteriota bacterium]